MDFLLLSLFLSDTVQEGDKIRRESIRPESLGKTVGGWQKRGREKMKCRTTISYFLEDLCPDTVGSEGPKKFLTGTK